ncbi:MAG TPA: NfeD family protein [Parachlamydiaceae bacterium]|nr:NfeD family protein [Parachlamydiaceae bacterium]
MIPFILLGLGLVLILMEFFLPGIILGVSGGLLVIASIVLFAMQANSIWWVVLYVIGIVVVLIYLVKFAIWRIRTAKPSRSIYSDSSQTGYVASSFDATAIGKTGVVVTDLKPGGHILVDGKRQQAISQGGYITKGTEVVVLSGQEESLIVKPIKDKT